MKSVALPGGRVESNTGRGICDSGLKLLFAPSLAAMAFVSLAMVAIGSDQQLAGFLKMSADSLRGLDEFRVHVQIADGAVRQLNLTHDEIQARIELRLRKNGLRFVESSQKPVLAFAVELAHNDNHAAYYVNSELRQLVTVNATREQVVASTWTKAVIGGGRISQMRDAILKEVDLLVDLFSNDFLAVNEHAVAR